MFSNIINKLLDKTAHTLLQDGISVWAPVSGKIIPLDKVPDAVFSQKIIGDGTAIIPSCGNITSPFNGEVIAVFPTGHAIGIRSAEGIECLIHVGIDTVTLNGSGFKLKVSQGQKVQQGTLLVEADLPYIEQSGKSTITPIIITNPQQWKIVQLNEDGEVYAAKDKLFIVKRC